MRRTRTVSDARRRSVPAETALIPSSGQFSGWRVLVTGASGFIGSHLCRRLVGDAAEIHAVSRSTHPDDGAPVRWWQGDLADIATVRGIFRGAKPDFVFHLASHVMGAPTLEHVLPTFHDNLQTTVNLLTAAAELGCRRIVLAGSLVEPQPGHDEYAPCSPYAAAKCASSAYARMFHALYGVPAVIARVFMVYGPRQQDSSKLIPYVTRSLLQGQRPRITSGGRLVDWIYVDDVVNGLLAAAQAPGVDGSTIDLGSGRLVSIRDIVQHLAKLVDSRARPAFDAVPERPLEPIRWADTSRTYATIGWRPLTALGEGLQLTVKWYQKDLECVRAGRRVARARP